MRGLREPCMGLGALVFRFVNFQLRLAEKVRCGSWPPQQCPSGRSQRLQPNRAGSSRAAANTGQSSSSRPRNRSRVSSSSSVYQSGSMDQQDGPSKVLPIFKRGQRVGVRLSALSQERRQNISSHLQTQPQTQPRERGTGRREPHSSRRVVKPGAPTAQIRIFASTTMLWSATRVFSGVTF